MRLSRYMFVQNVIKLRDSGSRVVVLTEKKNSDINSTVGRYGADSKTPVVADLLQERIGDLVSNATGVS